MFDFLLTYCSSKRVTVIVPWMLVYEVTVVVKAMLETDLLLS
jgi:hypothetical protein